jgi:predicted permease
LAIDGKPVAEAKLPEVGYQPVSDGYFSALGVALKQGRFFTAADHDSAPGVVIVSEGLARQFWPGEDPIGARVRLGPDASEPWSTVVGVVGDIGLGVLGVRRPTAYVSSRQDHWGAATVVMRTSIDPLAVLPGVRQVVRTLDPAIPLSAVNSLRGAQGEGLVDRRLTMQLLGVFALVAVLLAAVGVYGVMAFLVAARSREIGVRMALGARPRSVFALVVGQGLLPAIAGLAIGVVGALALSRAIAGMLYGVGATDGVTFAGVVAVVLAATIGACLVPARRATRIDPIEAMRAD